MDALTLFIFILFIPTNLLMSLVVFLNNKKSWTNRLFSVLIVVLTIYLVINSTAYFPYGYDFQLFFSRSIMAVAALINLLVFVFLNTFPSVKWVVNKTVFFVAALVTGILSGLAVATPLIFESITISETNIITPTPGLLMPVFLVHTLVLIGWGIFSIIKHYRQARGQEKEKIGYVLLSFFVLFTLILLFNFILTVFFKISFLVPLLPLYLLTFNVIVGFAIIKRRLLDIKSLVTRSVTYVLLIASIALIYAGVLFFLVRFIFDIDLSTQLFALFIILAVILAFSFQTISRGVSKITNKFFYRDYYNSEKLLYKLSLIMASTLRLEELIRKLLIEILETQKIDQGMIILIEESKVYQIISEGYTDAPVFDESEIQELAKENGVIVADELSSGSVKTVLEKYNFGLVSRFFHENKTVGLIGLGQKLSGESFSETDTTVLSIFSPEAAVAIQNAKSYEEIRRFNITLKEEIEEATAELVTANKKLQELDALKDEFVSIASHELRTPMVSIKNYLWMTLAGKGGKISQKQKFYLDRAYDSANRMTKLVNDMLNISRIESGRILLSVQKVNLLELAQNIVTDLTLKAKQQEITLEVDGSAVVSGSETRVNIPDVIADSDKVAEVIINFLSNALKFTPAQGKIIIHFEVDQAKESVILHVTDTGVGLTPDQMPKLFKKFGMLKESYSSISDAAQGTGLGLYISKSVVELHGGRIWVSSEGHGKGATFSFSLPMFNQIKMEALQKKFANGSDAGLIHTTLVQEK